MGECWPVAVMIRQYACGMVILTCVSQRCPGILVAYGHLPSVQMARCWLAGVQIRRSACGMVILGRGSRRYMDTPIGKDGWRSRLMEVLFPVAGVVRPL